MNPKQQESLLKLARQSIQYGIEHNTVMQAPKEIIDESFKDMRASFVTLEKNQQLRGCIGSLIAQQDLLCDIIHNAYKAAFADPRFPKVTQDELNEITISISILSPPEPINFTDEVDLINQIRPKIDGLILQDGANRGTFLPSVWESLPDKTQFLQHLKQKAGLPASHWSDTLKCFRYETEYFGE